ncbi:aspartate/glutamate racemase family protein [Kitasatospora sp. NBC_01266]|uniref:aspartate/glutamate racemase family protein n=1 Tax=Kitasatospora sp. NBC_01266 TaxID=2903572 RepID=UPI002E2ED951|nr:aspartate/glutamate racemase family protein [Kitasatospora sp. NBC_01266]
MVTIGFLHTSPVHPPAFHDLLTELAPQAMERHLVDESLLADARAGRPYADRLRARLGELAGAGAEVIVCTCSTIGGTAEQLAEQPAPEVLRIDRPMAEQAARYPRIGVLHAVESTLAPTRALLIEAGADAAGLRSLPCPGAWALFEAGDLAGYHAAVAQRIRAAVGGDGVDVVVLAQASMAPALDLLGELPVPVLSSPRPAVRRALRLAGVDPA